MTMKKKAIFKTNIKKTAKPATPEGLFRDLKARSPDIQHLWSHQADLLRSYYDKHLNSRDVALELPTGSGKTLVGLLIGEFRRRCFDERIAYLCPTKQLAQQVGEHASQYGIPASVLVGKQNSYSEKDYNAYQSGTAIAITTYSGLFNTNPRIKEPNTLVLDDAHAGEHYMSGLWSVSVTRSDHRESYLGIVDLFASVLPLQFAEDLKSDRQLPPGQQVEMVPGPYFRERADQLVDFLDGQLGAGDSAYYPWSMIRGRLRACNLFLSSTTALLRPLIPPTLTHAPFANAKQRVFMSATLGAGGELERITGISSIRRLPLPAGWDKQGSGRRLFLLPGLSLDDDSSLHVSVELCRKAGRSLVLVPDSPTREKFSVLFQKSGIDTIGAQEIENSLEPFTLKDNVALILANRYDGIDLPGDSCRMLVVSGLPVSTNLQETFLYSRLSAYSLLRDRVLTRLTQAFGRCTRSDTDFATVLLHDQRLIQYVLTKENQVLVHPELQAEIEFGINNSQDGTVEDYFKQHSVFTDQKEDWSSAEEDILNIRASKHVASDPCASALMSTVKDEVMYSYCLWRDDLEGAIEASVSVSNGLSGGTDIKGYRTWWYYLVGDLALMLYEAKGDKNTLNLARDYFGRAASCSLSVSWFAELSRLQIEGKHVAEVDQLTPIATENALQQLITLGFHSSKFEKKVKCLLSDIASTNHSDFHNGLKILGTCLGFNAQTPKGSAVPDCVWSLSDKLHISHEAKTEQSEKGVIGATDVRQAAGHENWVRDNCSISNDSIVLCLIESPRQRVDSGAVPHAAKLYYVPPNDIGEMAEELVSVLRSVRAESASSAQEDIAVALKAGMEKSQLLPQQIVERFSKTIVADLPT